MPQAKKLPCKMPSGQKNIGRKIATPSAKPVSVKAAQAQMGMLMQKKATHKR
jgi:hypothetical protein